MSLIEYAMDINQHDNLLIDRTMFNPISLLCDSIKFDVHQSKLLYNHDRLIEQFDIDTSYNSSIIITIDIII